MSTEAIDDYLKVIFALTSEGGVATTGDIAARLELTPASVSAMIKKLGAQSPPLVDYTKSRGVRLAEAGRQRALEVIRHHRLLETFLHDFLKIPLEKVHEEAEKLEHYISENLEDVIANHMGDPKHDPHGAPIPRRDGSIPEQQRISVLDLKPGETARLVLVPAKDVELSEYLTDLGLQVGCEVTLDSIEPFEGPVYLNVNGNRVGIGRDVARQLLLIRKGD